MAFPRVSYGALGRFSTEKDRQGSPQDRYLVRRLQRAEAVKTFTRVMMHCTLAAVAAAHGQAAQDTNGGGALPQSTAVFQAVDDRNPLHARLDAVASRGIDSVIKDRRYIHQHPELSNREFETSAYIAARARALGLEVRTPIGRTGVVAVLRGAKPGPTVALRAELDALPYTEVVDLPFKSTVRATNPRGETVGVMHACGHDAHMAMLLGVAAAFMQIRDQLPGTIVFIFQPGEEGPPPGEVDGALQLINAGVLSGDPRPEVIFGAHFNTQLETGQIGYRVGDLLQAAMRSISRSMVARWSRRGRGTGSMPLSSAPRSCWVCRPSQAVSWI